MNNTTGALTAFLQRMPFFKGLSENSRRSLAEVCAFRALRKKEPLFHEQEQGRSMYLLVEGRVQLFKTGPDGREVVIRIIKPGEIFAEVVLFERDRYPVSAVAVLASRLVMVPRSGIHALLERADFRHDFITMLMEKQRYLTERIQSLTSDDLEARFFAFVRDQYGTAESIQLDIPKKDIAAAIGVTPEALSRLLARLRKDRRIRITGRTLNIRASAPLR